MIHRVLIMLISGLFAAAIARGADEQIRVASAGWNADDLTPISEHYFTDGLEGNGWVVHNRQRVSRIQDDAVPVHPPNVAARLFPKGEQAGGGTAMYRRVEGERTTLHAGIWVKYSENFVQHSSGVTKLFFFWTAQQPRVFLTPYGDDLTLRTLLRHSPDRHGPGGYRLPNMVPAAEARLKRGQWHKVEMRVESASEAEMGDEADGRIRVWLDDVLVADYTGLDTHWEGESHHWYNLQWSTIWGGVDQQVPHDMHMYAGGLFLAGSK